MIQAEPFHGGHLAKENYIGQPLKAVIVEVEAAKTGKIRCFGGEPCEQVMLEFQCFQYVKSVKGHVRYLCNEVMMEGQMYKVCEVFKPKASHPGELVIMQG